MKDGLHLIDMKKRLLGITIETSRCFITNMQNYKSFQIVLVQRMFNLCYN